MWNVSDSTRKMKRVIFLNDVKYAGKTFGIMNPTSASHISAKYVRRVTVHNLITAGWNHWTKANYT